MNSFHFIEPLDVLYLRGNKLFGDPGSYGESMIPPWPSVAAGALRSWMLAAEGIDFNAFARGEHPHPALGTPAAPGRFAIIAFHLARECNGRIETMHPPTADLIPQLEDEHVVARALKPVAVTQERAFSSSSPLSSIPVLAEDQRRKPAAGYWLTQPGYARHLRREGIEPTDFVSTRDLWSIDERVGVGLDPELRRAEDGKLFSTQAIALRPGVGFLVGVAGAILPDRGTVRLGGDGRAAVVHSVRFEPPPIDLELIRKMRKCRVVLTTPGIFGAGWRLPGMDLDGRFELHGVRGRVVAAAVSRAEVISGFDLARWRPKPAERVAAAGSVYWMEELDASPGALDNLIQSGLWPADGENAARRAEGLNRFLFAVF